MAGLVYNFWDRIGDLLYCYFATGLPPGSVYVGRVLNNMSKEVRKSPYYLRLVAIYESNVKEFVKDRNVDAHNQSMASRRYYDTILARGKTQAEQVAAKYRLPEMLKEQISLANEAFELALILIESEGVPPLCDLGLRS